MDGPLEPVPLSDLQFRGISLTTTMWRVDHPKSGQSWEAWAVALVLILAWSTVVAVEILRRGWILDHLFS